MAEHNGNKTLLPLEPGPSPFEGKRPILLHILEQLPSGPKAVVIHHRREDVIRATRHLGLTYCDQPSLNGTGGALLAARPFLESVAEDRVIMTMGDVPFVRRTTYRSLLERLDAHPLAVLGFEPLDRKQYGVLETEGPVVHRIVEWKYWHGYSKTERDLYRICNAGIYVAHRPTLLRYLESLEKRPHSVLKDRNGRAQEIEEFFITDLVELMAADGLQTGYILAEDETEVMGIDDADALLKAQRLYSKRLFMPDAPPSAAP
jgi:bifunctional UDP-N-acetylglucosamine pyrophosphorylase/glucosamine-1-phosphate N-acetyltransferase